MHIEQLVEMLGPRKEQVVNFLNWLNQNTVWKTAPASTKFHCCQPGGLIVHSLNVTETVLKLKNLMRPEITDESCVICGLFHDLGKVGEPGKPLYLWDGKAHRVNAALTYIDTPTRSLHLLAGKVDLNVDEVQAIRAHDGLYVPDNASYAQKEQPMTLLLHWADMWCCKIVEK